MKKKRMKGLPKRIAAFVMALLMFFSLMPIDPSIVLAEDGACTFNVTSNSSPVENATINIYREGTLVATNVTDNTGSITIQANEGDTYEIISHGYKVKTGSITEETEYSIELEAYPKIGMSGTITLPEGATSFEKVVAVLYEKVSDETNNEISRVNVGENGEYTFAEVVAGYKYFVSIISIDNSYQQITSEVIDLAYAIEAVEVDSIELVANESLTFGFSEEAHEVYIDGTPKTFEPTVEDVNGAAPSDEYTITYTLKNASLEDVIKVEKDSEQNLVVQALAGATSGDVVIVATLTGPSYVTKLVELTVQVKEKAENENFNFNANGVTNEGSAEIDYSPDGTCDFDVTAGVNGDSTGVSYGVIADGEGEESDVIEIDENNGTITILKAGKTTITATLPAAGDYLATTIKLHLTVKKIEQTHDVKFTNSSLTPEGGRVRYTFGENENTYNFKAESTDSEVAITYSVIYKDETDKDALGENLATINDGNITFNQVGIYEVIATSSKANYFDKTVRYEVEITKADPVLYFAIQDDVDYKNTITNGKYLLNGFNFHEPELKASTGVNLSTGVTYSTESNLVEINETTGEITFVELKDASVSGPVEITITATRDEDASYIQDTASYTFMIEDWPPTDAWEDIYSITEPNANGWYSKISEQNPITVTIKDGKEYVIFAEAPTALTVDNGATTYDVTSLDDGENKEISFYVMDASEDGNGYISAKHTIDGIKVDSVASGISVKKDEFSLLDYFLYFFKWDDYNPKFKVQVEGESLSSNTVYYYVADGATVVAKNDNETIGDAIERLVDGEWLPYTEVIKFSADQKSVIYAKVEDKAGNTAYAHTNGLITDNTAPEISVIEPDTVNGYYKDDFSIEVDATDSLSGIKELYYQIGSQDAEKNYLMQNTILNNTTDNNLVYDTSNMVVPSIDIVLNDNNNIADGVTIYIGAVDNSGNTTIITKSYKICKETPEIQIVFNDNNEYIKDINGIKYYDAVRTATITIVSRYDVFEKDNITVTLNEQPVNCTWDNQIASVPITTNGINTLHVEYENKIGDEAVAVTETFGIDTDEPSGSVSVITDTETKTWEAWLEKLTFGIWKKPTEVTKVKMVANTDTTQVSMYYYVSHEKTLLTKDFLSEIFLSKKDEWKPYTSGEEILFDEENIYAIYFRLEDMVKNVTYLSTDGFVLDGTESVITIKDPSPSANDYGYHNSDVKLNVIVKEKPELYSGIKEITYEVFSNGVCTQGDSLWVNSYNELPTYDELQVEFDSKQECYVDHKIEVSSELNNSDNVEVVVKAIDNAGNVSESEKYQLKINRTTPTVKIDYDNDEYTGYDGLTYYFNANRKATIQIIDRATTFNSSNPNEVIEVRDKNGAIVTDDRILVDTEWNPSGSSDVHEASVSFLEDGYYTIDVKYTNKAGLGVEGTGAPLGFVIDKAKPTNVSVSLWNKTWDRFFELITFGLYTAEDVVLTIKGDDVTSNKRYEYYISKSGQILSEDDLKNISDEDWTLCNGTATISEEQQMIVYARVTDQAGNRVYVNTDGVVYDKTAAGIVIKAEGPCTNDIFTGDVDVKISVDDTAITSGIKNVEYWITCDGIEKHRETLYAFNKNAPSKADLKQNFNETIRVVAQEYNSCNVVVNVQVTDNAGNKSTEVLPLDIDIVAPTIDVSYDNNTVIEIVNGRGYFNATRYATITVTERTNHFNKDELINQIKIVAKDAKGNELEAAIPTVVYEKTIAGRTADDAQHIFKIMYNAEANYTFDISYTDKAGWKCASTQVNYGNSVTPKEFTVDTVAPTGKIAAGNLGVWESVLQTITFGLWSPDEIEIVITSDDITSPIKKVEYYKTTTFTALSIDDLKTVTSWVEADRVKVSTDDIFVVYGKVTDMTGHVQFIGTNGIIVDETKPVFESLSPEISLTPERPVNGIYDGNVRVDVGVVDPKVGVNSAYSGIRTIRYEVYNMGVKTQEGTLYNFTESNPVQNKLLQSWNDEDIIVDASKNNSNDIVVKVMANDNVGNYSEKEISLMIDTTKPVVEISYDNNNGDTTFADAIYYNTNRTATIKVTERNFDAKYVDVVITNTDEVIPNISEWTMKEGTGNGDDTVYTATIAYTVDGDYTFAISVKDKAGNASNGIDYGESQAPTAFTIDKTTPIISIVYDNNEFVNENYYKANRIATITINEHNFDASRVVTTITATDNGQPIDVPIISNWNKSGDTYTATVNYTTDALYTFDISYSDKAGNAAVDFADQSFYVDKTMPQMSITEIVDQSANNKDKIGFVITATDTNFDVFNPILTAVIKTENGFTTQELNIASISDITNGRVYTINNIDTDGIYRITCTLVDRAGNAYNSITLHQADGTPYVEERTSEDTLLSFSVNRDGSVFEVDDTTREVLDNYYVHDVKEDIVIIEVNANHLTSNNVSLNGKELVEGTDFTVDTEGGNGTWLRYSYSLNKALFVEEGEYTVVVSSVDEAENNAFSDVKNTKVAFVVDRTAPVVTISGLETDGRYQTNAQTVTMLPIDDGGAIKSIIVNQVDEDGKIIKTLQEELSGDALEEILNANDGQIRFNIPSGQYDYIKITCSDCSVNSDGKTNVSEILIENVLITENPIEIFWATYQYAIIGGGAVAVAAPTGVVFFRRIRLKVK